MILISVEMVGVMAVASHVLKKTLIKMHLRLILGTMKIRKGEGGAHRNEKKSGRNKGVGCPGT